DRRTVMGLDMAPHATRVVGEPPPRPLERVIDGHDRVGETIAGSFGFFGAADIDFPALGQRESNRDLAGAARAMPLAWRLDDDVTGRDAATPLLQDGNVLRHAGTQLVVSHEALKVDFDRGLHAGSPGFDTPTR